MLMVMTRQSRKKYLKKDHVDPILGTVQMQAVCIGYFPRAHTHTHTHMAAVCTLKNANTHTHKIVYYGQTVQTSDIN